MHADYWPKGAVVLLLLRLILWNASAERAKRQGTATIFRGSLATRGVLGAGAAIFAWTMLTDWKGDDFWATRGRMPLRLLISRRVAVDDLAIGGRGGASLVVGSKGRDSVERGDGDRKERRRRSCSLRSFGPARYVEPLPRRSGGVRIRGEAASAPEGNDRCVCASDAGTSGISARTRWYPGAAQDDPTGAKEIEPVSYNNRSSAADQYFFEHPTSSPECSTSV